MNVSLSHFCIVVVIDIVFARTFVPVVVFKAVFRYRAMHTFEPHYNCLIDKNVIAIAIVSQIALMSNVELKLFPCPRHNPHQCPCPNPLPYPNTLGTLSLPLATTIAAIDNVL